MSLLTHFFPRDPTFGFESLRTAGYALYGGADLGEVIAICSRIRSGNEDSWMREWEAAADRALANAETSSRAGNTISAHESYLRAFNYYRTAEFFRRDDPFNDKIGEALYQKCVDAFVLAMKFTDYAFEAIEIPYEGKTLPGYFIKPDASGKPRPTIILNGGFDSIREEVWFAIGAPALRRGYNVMAFDGPGQGLALRRDRLTFRPDWENVLKPVMDYTLGRNDVAADKVVVFGWSMGGYLVSRGATKEHRAAALVLDDGVFDFGQAFRGELPGLLNYAVKNHWDGTANTILGMGMKSSTSIRWPMLNGKWTFGVDSVSELVRRSAEYTLDGRADQVKTQTLVLDAPDDHFMKGQPQELMKRLTCKKKLVTLTAEEGASTHCHMGAFGRLHQVVFDYLAEVL